MLRKFIFIILLSSVFWGCSDDSSNADCNSVNFVIDFKAEQDAISEAQFAYLIDDSDENCKAAKMVVSEYLAVLELYENCEFEEPEDENYRTALEDLRVYLASLPC